MTDRIPLNRVVVALLVSAPLASCSSSDNTSLAILNIAVPDNQCRLPAQPEFFASSGQFDPQFTQRYTYAPLVANLLSNSETTNQTFFTETEVFVDGNSIAVLGFDVCYLRGDDSRVADLGDFENGVPVDCSADSLPGEFVSARNTIAPGTQSPLAPSVLGDAALVALFGDEWDSTQRRFTSGSQLRSVVILSRAVGERANGESVTSEYFPFQVDVVPGQVQAFCDASSALIDFEATCDISILAPVCVTAATN